MHSAQQSYRSIDVAFALVLATPHLLHHHVPHQVCCSGSRDCPALPLYSHSNCPLYCLIPCFHPGWPSAAGLASSILSSPPLQCPFANAIFCHSQESHRWRIVIARGMCAMFWTYCIHYLWSCTATCLTYLRLTYSPGVCGDGRCVGASMTEASILSRRRAVSSKWSTLLKPLRCDCQP